MRISTLSQNKYNNINFTHKQNNEKKHLNHDKILKLCAAGALTSLAIAYGGGKIILEDYKNNVNQILDKYEKELVLIKTQNDTLANDTITMNQPELDINF